LGGARGGGGRLTPLVLYGEGRNEKKVFFGPGMYVYIIKRNVRVSNFKHFLD